jgi:polyhydroxyalkanoate synthase subunit PhaC
MDLSPKKSVIKNLLSRGLDVYLIDWGHPSWNDDDLALEDYIEYVNHAVEVIKDNSKVKDVSILGYCWGGIISLIYASIYKESVKKLAVMASPVDTSKDNSMLSVWIKSIDSNKMIKEFRHMDGQLLDIGFVMRNPAKYAFDKYLKFYQKISDKDYVDTFMAVEKWLYNTPSIPAKLYTQIIDGCYKNNLLCQNKMNIYDKEINLGTISVPILIITAKDDDLVSPESTMALKEILPNAPKISTLQIPGGHVGLCISSKAHKNLWPQTSEWFLENN